MPSVPTDCKAHVISQGALSATANRRCTTCAALNTKSGGTAPWQRAQPRASGPGLSQRTFLLTVCPTRSSGGKGPGERRAASSGQARGGSSPLRLKAAELGMARDPNPEPRPKAVSGWIDECRMACPSWHVTQPGTGRSNARGHGRAFVASRGAHQARHRRWHVRVQQRPPWKKRCLGPRTADLTPTAHELSRIIFATF